MPTIHFKYSFIHVNTLRFIWIEFYFNNNHPLNSQNTVWQKHFEKIPLEYIFRRKFRNRLCVFTYVFHAGHYSLDFTFTLTHLLTISSKYSSKLMHMFINFTLTWTMLNRWSKKQLLFSTQSISKHCLLSTLFQD